MTAAAVQAEVLVEPGAHRLRPHGVGPAARLYGTPALHRLVPLRVGISLAHARGRIEWLVPARRSEMLSRSRGLLGDAPAASAERLARRMLCEQAVHTELSWRPWLVRRTVFHGLEHLEAARENGHGVLVATIHLGPLASLAQALPARGIPLRVVLKPPRTKPLPRGYVGWWLREQQTRFESLGGRFVDAPGSARTLRRLLEGGEVCLLAMDMRGRIEATLLGRPVQVAAGPARLARLTGAAVIPATVLREGARVVIRLAEPLEPAPGESDAAFTQRILDVLGPYASAHPEQANPQLSRLLAASPTTARGGESY